MKPIIYMVCGVPGSGKTWVCSQLLDKFEYIQHDKYTKALPEVLKFTCKNSAKPIITDCPFGERKLKESIELLGMEVIPVFIVEDPDLVKSRYETRDKKPFPKSGYTRRSTIVERAKEWNAVYGTSEFILEYLKTLKV